MSVKVTWEPQVAETIRQRISSKSSPGPFLVGLVGQPGSGKSTSSNILIELLSSPEDENKQVFTMTIPMDGYHIALKTLQSMENSKDLIYRRGAPDTFDAKALKEDLFNVKHSRDRDVLKFPGFDHAIGDPQPDCHTFKRNKHSVVICEGLYLLHDSDGWDLKDIFDLTVFIKTDTDKCIDRLKIRNKCIPGYTEDEIDIRCEVVDRRNANTVLASCHRADIVVESCID